VAPQGSLLKKGPSAGLNPPSRAFSCDLADDAPQAPPDRPRLRDRQGLPGLLRLQRRVGDRPHLSDPGWSRQPALVLVANRQRVATLEAAKAEFRKSWDAWKAWAGLEEVA
jgi:hypothetical protein